MNSKRFIYKHTGLGFDLGGNAIFRLWAFDRVLVVKNTKKHYLLFSQRNGYTGRTFGKYHVSFFKPMIF